MIIEILENDLDPWQRLLTHQSTLSGYGATAVFVGTMRDFNERCSVQRMFLEYYPGMTEKEIKRYVQQALGRWELIDVLVCHRVGSILPNDPIVLVAVWSVHRADAFEASRYVMEKLKSQAPFWKKELGLEGDAYWVEKNTVGYKIDDSR